MASGVSHPAPRVTAPAFRRRLSGRDVRELARVASALTIAGAQSFTMRGVTVQLTAQHADSAQVQQMQQPATAADAAQRAPGGDGQEALDFLVS